MILKKYITLLLTLTLILCGMNLSIISAKPEITITNSTISVIEAPADSALIAALYKGEQFTGTKIYKGIGTITGNYSKDLTDLLDKSDNIKVFLWNFNTLEPIASIQSRKLSDLVSDKFVFIKGGTFQMGSSPEEFERDLDETQHNVTVGNFYMSATEVTQSEYTNLMGNNPSETSGDNLPVTNVTWYDAVKFCNKMSISKGLTPCYTIDNNTITWNKSANGYRLPTEAEWEYACRANTNTPFNFGDYVNDKDANCYNAYGYNNDASGSWVNGYLEHTVDVNNYPKNSYGLYNMHGNVAEWVWDWYGDYNSNDIQNPTGNTKGNYKIARGGGWNDFPKHIRSAYRNAFPADVPFYNIGIRLVRNSEPEQGTVVSTTSIDTNINTKKTLMVYFSQTGNTDGLANIIAEMRNVDVFRIERETPYSSTYNSQGLYAETLEEYRTLATPPLKTTLEEAGININQYDTILLGYCNWWASIPAPIRTFLKTYDLSGKTIIPFCSMGGGRFGQTISAVAKLAPNSIIKKGLDVSYSSYNREKIENWLTENGVMNNKSDKKTAVVYFSATNNTRILAQKVANIYDSDIFEIVPEVSYTAEDLEYYNYDNRANTELSTDARPSIKTINTDFSQYDTILLGYPIWHSQLPPVVRTFLDNYNMSNKIIMPFCTSGSTLITGSLPKIQELCPNSTITNGFRGTSSTTETQIKDWIDKNKPKDDKMLKIQIGNHILKATLFENSSTEALKELLADEPLTINMSDYGNFEKVGSLLTSLPRNDEQIVTEAGDLILYQGNSFVIYYDTNEWNFTRLGKINNVTEKELKTILGSGNVTVTLSLD